jgi:hypothetical protein
MWTNLLCISHDHILVHLSCHSITKTKQGPFTLAQGASEAWLLGQLGESCPDQLDIPLSTPHDQLRRVTVLYPP